jgi:hypothetical protein
MTSQVGAIHQALEEAANPAFWLSLNPHMSITENPFAGAGSAYDFGPEEGETAVEQIKREGYFQTRPLLPVPEIEQIKRAILNILHQGFPPLFALVYDEFWQVFARLSRLLSPVLGEDYKILADFWIFYVDPSQADSGWSPHRDFEFDKGCLRSDGRPTILTAWIPFTDATPLNSCLYVLPLHLDPYSPKKLKDKSKSIRVDIKSLADIRALPAPAGSVIGFNQYLLHWGSRSSQLAHEPRISIGIYLQSGDVAPYFERLAVDRTSPVSFEYRMAVIGRMIRKYRSNSYLSGKLDFPSNLLQFLKKYEHLITKQRV